MTLKKQWKSSKPNGSMTNKQVAIFSYLDELYPDAHCELNYSKDYELLIAVMLSAQTTDKAVNSVTAVLFNKYKTVEELANARLEDVKKIISTIGMYKVKSKNVIDIANDLVNRFNSKVPHDKELLTSMPGVGNKTANCVLAELWNEPYLAVDTHMQRFAKRMGIAKHSDSVETMEKKYLCFIPRERIIKTNHQIIWFGRYSCKAISPKCENCKLKEYCKNN